MNMGNLGHDNCAPLLKFNGDSDTVASCVCKTVILLRRKRRRKEVRSYHTWTSEQRKSWGGGNSCAALTYALPEPQ